MADLALELNDDEVVVEKVDAERWIPAIASLKQQTFHVPLYSAPSAESVVIGKIAVGDAVHYQTPPVDGWWHIRYANSEGYVRVEDFEPIAGESPSPPVLSENLGLYFDI